MSPFLPVTGEETGRKSAGIIDIIIITGDAYVDHPSYGAAVIGRVLEKAGFSVGIISQPDWRKNDDFMRLGRPKLFFGITAGNLDSMVANYTASKRPRKKDGYSPGGMTGLRPDRAVIVYANKIKELYSDTPIVIGGTEASMRRLAHYDWWDNCVRRSILVDSRADILVYGMGEKQVVEIARRMAGGHAIEGIPGTAVIMKDPSMVPGAGRLPSFNEVANDAGKHSEAFKIIASSQDPFHGKPLVQAHGNQYVVQYPPPIPFSTGEIDSIYELPYMYGWHPSYDAAGGVPGFETVRHSVTSHRGCCGECSFCSISMHQGRIIQSRSAESILKEITGMTKRPGFRGTVTDVGGPTVNLYGAECTRWKKTGACSHRSCLTPEVCTNLKLAYKSSLDLYREILSVPGVRHVFLESGFRHDLFSSDENSRRYIEGICARHISGYLKAAPEHVSEKVLALMNKPSIKVYEEFVKRFREANRKAGKKNYLVNYFISAHPGSTLQDALDLSLYLLGKGIHPEQIQDFIPLPMTLSGCMYYSEKNPVSGEKLHVAKTFRERKMHRALLQYRNPASRKFIQEALELLKKQHLMHIFFPAVEKKEKRGRSKKNNHKGFPGRGA